MNNLKLHSGMIGVRSINDQHALNEDEERPSPLTIKLIDHTIIPSENSPGIWARSAKVVDYVIVSGSRTRAGAYVAWNCSIETFEGAHFIVRKRYSEFVELRDMLLETFPRSRVSIPNLPPKSVVCTCFTYHAVDVRRILIPLRVEILTLLTYKQNSGQNFLKPAVRAYHIFSHASS